MTPDFYRELESHRSYLLRVARLQLRDDALAEDVVQEPLPRRHCGQRLLRQVEPQDLAHRHPQAQDRRRDPAQAARAGWSASTLDDERDIEDFDALFDANGALGEPPADWGNPEAALDGRQFFDIMDFCLEKLPPNTARVFMMREVMELETDEICKELAITANNLWVILYRARMSLRECLEQNWFARGAPPT